MLFKNALLATLDLSDAFNTIPIAESDRKYLRFSFKGKLYEFLCVPFALGTSPYIFTKIMKPVAENLRSQSLLSIIYLDDFLLIGKSKNNVRKT